jgi:hypothetical protein
MKIKVFSAVAEEDG